MMQEVGVHRGSFVWLQYGNVQNPYSFAFEGRKERVAQKILNLFDKPPDFLAVAAGPPRVGRRHLPLVLRWPPASADQRLAP